MLFSQCLQALVIGIEIFHNDERSTRLCSSVQQVMNTALRSPTTATLLKEMDSVGNGRGHEGDDACIG